MDAKLPRELRDMIFWYLAVPGPPTIYPTRPGPIYAHRKNHNPNFQSAGGEMASEYEDARRMYETGSTDRLRPGGWLLNAEFVGSGMAREIAQTFYTVKSFDVHVDSLETLLLEDRTGTNLKPYEYIRTKVSVRVPTTCNNVDEKAWRSTENEVAFLNGLYTRLSRLMLLANNPRVEVVIWLETYTSHNMTYEQGERRFYNILQAVRAPVYNLIHAGMDVSVRQVRLGSYKGRNLSAEPSNYFNLSREAWEAEKGGHGADWMPSRDFIMGEELDDGDLERRAAAVGKLREALEQRWGHFRTLDTDGTDFWPEF